jgi:DNA polymerase III delta prime subunit
MELHKNIKDKLTYFIKDNKIPHILFHGPSGSGKRTLVYKFVADIYNNDKNLIKNYTMFADCAHGKGIKFIRDELKFFAKTNVNIKGVGHFKTIVLTNADKLTTDAQSALRRCIELFSHNTRFFIIVENKYNLLKPILSRLCEIYIDIEKPLYNTSALLNSKEHEKVRETWLEIELNKLQAGEKTNIGIIKLVNKLYDKGYSGLDLMNLIEKQANTTTDTTSDTTSDTTTDTTSNTVHLLKTYTQLMLFHKVKSEFRNEKLFMTFILIESTF